MTGSFVVPEVIYLQSLGLPRDALIQATACCSPRRLWLSDAHCGRGLLTTGHAVVSIVALLPAVVGMLPGQKIRRNLSEQRFRRVLFVCFFDVWNLHYCQRPRRFPPGKMSEFIDYLHEVFTHFGPIETRRMFGGYGVYHDGLMFALVANDVVYLKADTHTARYFEELGLAQFEYQRQGKKMNMSYYLAPEEIFDDPDLARQWAVRAFEAALRARKNRRTEVSRRAKNQSKINGVRHD